MTTPTSISSLDGISHGPHDVIAVVHGPGKRPTRVISELVNLISESFLDMSVNNKLIKQWENGPKVVCCSSGSQALRGRLLTSVILVEVPENHLEQFYLTIYPTLMNGGKVYDYLPTQETP
jgi:7-keto-8-aminopelargonate synthetase-like enzyme